jgi:hypothetical protein
MKAIAHRALFERINRKLRHQEQRLSRDGEHGKTSTRYEVVGIKNGCVYEANVSLEDLGRRMFVLKPHETLAES